MSSETGRLPEYSACMHSLFISYAHADDIGHNRWVEALRDAIWNRLAGLPRDIIRHGIHFSQENGPSAGHLGHELEERVRKSFALLLVVGDRYVDSNWCERELELFTKIFGVEGTKSRLFVVVMSKSAHQAVRKSKVWQQLVAPDQVCIPMYQDQYPDTPIRARNDLGGISQTLHEASFDFTKRLMETIETSAAKEKLVSPPAPAPTAKLAVPATERLNVAIAPCTENLAQHVEMLRNALQRSGANVCVLNRELIFKYDPDANHPLGPDFAAAHTLVAPLSESQPLRPDLHGGHVALLREEWDKLKKSRPIVWYQPADIAVTPSECAQPKHLEVFKQLDPIYASERAVVNHLFTTGNTLRVYIEKHRQEPAYWLTDELDAAWNALPPEPGRPALDYCFLELAKIGSVTDDAAGVILLMPEGVKDLNALYAQMECVRRAFPRRGAYPGVVACIFNPPPRVQPGLVHDWAEVHFYRSDDASKFESDADSKRWLNGFVQQIWRKYKNSPSGQVH
jgi:hypothetical protein